MQTRAFGDVDWSQLDPRELHSVFSRVSAAMKAGRPQKPPAEVPEILKGTNRYVASIQKVVPAAARDTLAQHRRCILGCSLGSKNSEGAPLEGTLRLIAANFDECAVLVADNVYRLTLQLTRGLTPDASLPAALAAGREFVDRHRPILESVSGGRCRVHFVLLSDVEKSPDFQPFHTSLRALYRAEAAFRASVDSFADIYLSRGDQAASDGERAAKVGIAADYLLEETALTACLLKQGYTVLFYPGAIKSFEDMIEGVFPGVPDELRRVVFVSVRLKRGGAHFLGGPSPGVGHDEIEPETHALLAGLPEAGWASLTAHADLIRCPPGAVLVQHGQSDRAMYILTEGRLEIVTPAGRRIAVVEAGSVFGEQAFVDAAPRSASVVALTACAALRLSQEGFELLKTDEPEIALQLLLDIARVLSQRLRARAA
jgi:tRNA-dependent cyclodipeptide synthase